MGRTSNERFKEKGGKIMCWDEFILHESYGGTN